MAIGTITSAAKTGLGHGPLVLDRISFAGDSSYPTGGTLTFQASVRAALKRDVTILDVISGDCGDHKVEYNKATDKLKVRLISTGAEVANEANLSGTTFNITVISE